MLLSTLLCLFAISIQSFVLYYFSFRCEYIPTIPGFESHEPEPSGNGVGRPCSFHSGFGLFMSFHTLTVLVLLSAMQYRSPTVQYCLPLLISYFFLECFRSNITSENEFRSSDHPSVLLPIYEYNISNFCLFFIEDVSISDAIHSFIFVQLIAIFH